MTSDIAPQQCDASLVGDFSPFRPQLQALSLQGALPPPLFVLLDSLRGFDNDEGTDVEDEAAADRPGKGVGGGGSGSEADSADEGADAASESSISTDYDGAASDAEAEAGEEAGAGTRAPRRAALRPRRRAPARQQHSWSRSVGEDDGGNSGHDSEREYAAAGAGASGRRRRTRAPGTGPPRPTDRSRRWARAPAPNEPASASRHPVLGDVRALGRDEVLGHPDAWRSLLELRLTHLGLSALPSALWLAPSLRLLDLSHNRLTALPDVSACSRLTRLLLAFNRIAVVLGANERVGNVTALSLRGNRIASTRGLNKLYGLQVRRRGEPAAALQPAAPRAAHRPTPGHPPPATYPQSLDLAHNLVASRGYVRMLAQLPLLRSLALAGNPLCSGTDHRALCAGAFLEQHIESGVRARPPTLPSTPCETEPRPVRPCARAVRVRPGQSTRQRRRCVQGTGTGIRHGAGAHATRRSTGRPRASRERGRR